MDKYGFVYIWYDRKRKMYYIGSHWGTEDDGYICSSNRMRKAYQRRPQDFKRRILSKVLSNRSDLLTEEQRWFDKVKLKERYYNLHWKVKDNSWWTDPDARLTVGEKISKANKGKTPTEEHRQKISKSLKGRKRKFSEDHKKSLAVANKRKAKPLSAEHKIKLSKAGTGKKYPNRSQEHRDKLSAAMKGKQGKPHTEEYKASVRKSRLYISPDGKNIIVENLKEFCRNNNLNYTNMMKLHSGSLKETSYRGWQKGT